MLLPMLSPGAAWVQLFGIRLGCFGGTSSDFHPMCHVIIQSLLGPVLAWVQMLRCVALCDEATLSLSFSPLVSSSPGATLRAGEGRLGLHRDTPMSLHLLPLPCSACPCEHWSSWTPVPLGTQCLG